MSNKSSFEKAMDERVSAHVHAGLYESNDPMLRQHAAMQGIYIPEAKKVEEQPREAVDPDPIADRIHGFWDKLDKFLYPICILLGTVIGYLQFDPSQHPDNQWQLPLIGFILGAACPLLLRSICVLAYLLAKLALYLAGFALIAWLIIKVAGPL